MVYPDGTPVNVGDHIWWNEGSCVGFVCTIIESEADQRAWGFDEPHVLLSGHHPYDPDDSGYIAYPITDFADEGIERLSSAEEEEFERALSHTRSNKGFSRPFHVGIDILSEEDGLWIFSSRQGDELREFGRVRRQK